MVKTLASAERRSLIVIGRYIELVVGLAQAVEVAFREVANIPYK